MTNVTVTGLRHHKLAEIQDCLIAPCKDGLTTKSFHGSACTVRIEHNEHAQPRKGEKLAFRVDCKGMTIGYINEPKTIEGWIEKAILEGKPSVEKRNRELLPAVEKVRDQLFTEYDNDLTKTEWIAPVTSLLYVNDSLDKDRWIGYEEFCQLKDQSNWKLVGVSIGFDID